MTAFVTVSNSSPLIALEQIGRLDLLEGLFRTIVVPVAVAAETAPLVDLIPWIEVRVVLKPLLLSRSLGRGETEAISLALEIGGARIILDDRAVRRQATSLGLDVIGTLGILSAAKERGMIPLLKPELDSLASGGFHLARDLYEQVLLDFGESP